MLQMIKYRNIYDGRIFDCGCINYGTTLLDISNYLMPRIGILMTKKILKDIIFKEQNWIAVHLDNENLEFLNFETYEIFQKEFVLLKTSSQKKTELHLSISSVIACLTACNNASQKGKRKHIETALKSAERARKLIREMHENG